ncbi:MocR-like pyridoxine biosynthesis transcription factor PdxR [Advenella mimigardefordensis]|uniref:Transcriptional regulator, GntR family n=1 Tax=Advenella mimigardefordensis (strain DSM 17166 / LMG 22922 / DPN7) TaxID=1247726 RepID=W0PGD4_ADVMD|nr:PLP-dependent aminotransferase family protein [Advenella mimigardefordensis]AHG66144.1 transcriptional regulator, GntR family [Advenella mimigardefordensis DPN7]
MNSTQRYGLSSLDPHASMPLYQQIYLRLRHAITDGLISPGERIPAARALAKELGLARGTIESAYDLLASEGYVQARGQAGTVVMPGLEHLGGTRLPAEPVAATFDTLPAHPPVPPFQLGLPALDAFPRKIWARLAARCARSTQIEDMVYPPFAGATRLREAIAGYLRVSRGIDCIPQQIFMTSGYRGTIDLVSRTLLMTGDRVWVEDPGYAPTRDVLRSAGLELVPVPVDGEGICVEQGKQRAANARLAVVTPAHQSPLCVSLSLARRAALLDWAAQSEAWIIEDDYDGEYRYLGRPLPALKSLDGEGRVIYSGTFSKVMFPGLRLAYCVVPRGLVTRFDDATQVLGSSAPALVQAIVTAFMKEGHFSRHIQRMRRLYAERRETVAAGLMDVLGNRLRVELEPGGMHLILRPHDGMQMDDVAIAQRICGQGMFAHGLSSWYLQPPVTYGLLMSFTNVTSRDAARKLGERILPLLQVGLQTRR